MPHSALEDNTLLPGDPTIAKRIHVVVDHHPKSSTQYDWKAKAREKRRAASTHAAEEAKKLLSAEPDVAALKQAAGMMPR